MGVNVVPGWVRPKRFALRDLACLALKSVVEEQARDAAGVVAVSGWVRGCLRGPATGRPESARSRGVALAELCAAECLLDDDYPAPPLHEVCQRLEVPYLPPILVDAGYGRGVWQTLRWVLGQTTYPPLILPLRRPDGVLMGDIEIYASYVDVRGAQRERARLAAPLLAADSRRLAAMVEDTAARIRA